MDEANIANTGASLKVRSPAGNVLLSMSPDGNRLFLTNDDGSVAMWQKRDGFWGFVTRTDIPADHPRAEASNAE